MPTDFDLLDFAYPLPREELYRQWVLAPDASSLPTAWTHRTLNGWTLAAHPDAHVCRLESADGQVLGWIMEPLLYTDARGIRRPDEAVRLPLAAAGISGTAIEQALYGRDAAGHTDGTGVEGMWIAVVICGACRRVYPGPTHSVVHAPGTRCVATSPNLLAPFERESELSRAFDPLETRRFFSFGLTAFRGIRRLLPNHYLDLDDFFENRHWPKAPPVPREGPEAAAEMVEHCRRIVGGVSEDLDAISVPLSAGNDSRAALSLLRPAVAAGRPEVKLFTSVGAQFDRRIDLQGARRLAKIAGLPLEVRRRGKPAAAPVRAVMRNFARIGEARAGAPLSHPDLLRPPTPGDTAPSRELSLAGMAGETARAFYWHHSLPKTLTAEDLLRRVDAPVLPRTVAAAQAWLDGLPDFVRADPADTLDLAYVEQRLGCWEAVSRYLRPGRRPKVISPMASGFCIERMLALPTSYRRSGTLQRDMVAHAWPELLAVPINRATGVLRLEQKARGLLRRTKRAGRSAVRLVKRRRRSTAEAR